MLDVNLIQSTSSWPFVEIRKLLKDRKDLIKSKNKIIFQTGYGPSGLPHIGRNGQYVFFLSLLKVGKIISIISSYFSKTRINELLNFPPL